MTQARAVAVILLPPEYRPTDPYPPHAPDDPGLEFTTYDDYWWWLRTKELRVAIHDPAAGATLVKRIARPSIYLNSLRIEPAWNGRFNNSAVVPMGAGALFIGENADSPDLQVEYCRYSAGDDPNPPELVVVIPPGTTGAGGYVVMNEASVAICMPGSVHTGDSGRVFVVTPEPAPGQHALVMIEAPNFIGSTYSADYSFQAAAFASEINFVSTEYGF